MKRPPSLSDSLIYVGNYNFESKEEFFMMYKTSDISGTELTEADTSGSFVFCNCEIICDYAIRFLLHITLISIFETVFFFLFVSIDEDNGIMGTIDFYTNSIINGCSNLNQNETVLLNDILTPFVNVSRIMNAGTTDSLDRYTYNNGLKILSWNYVIGIFVLLAFVTGFAKWRSYKIRWLHIICENIALVAMLGAYEYMFFMTVIVKYKTETPGEISALFINGLQTQCNLLKN